MGYERGFVTRVADREVQVGLRGHVQDLGLDGAQRRLDVAMKRRRIADIVLLPGAHLQNQIIGIGSWNEFRAKVLQGKARFSTTCWLS